MEDENLAQKAEERGEQLISRFKAMQDKFPDKVKEVRGEGLLTAFEMHDEPNLDGHTVSVELLKQGVYAKETHHSTVRVAPALTISADQIDRIADAIDNVVASL
jgi:ornithine--oxo-acid transaminase